MTNSQKGVPVGFLPLKTLNNFLRIEHNDLFVCNMMYFEFVITYMQKEITYAVRFYFNYIFFDKKCHICKEKSLILERGVFLATPISTAGVFSQIFTNYPIAQGLGNNLLYGSVGSYRKSMKYRLPPKKPQSHEIFPSIFIFSVRIYFPVAMA